MVSRSGATGHLQPMKSLSLWSDRVSTVHGRSLAVERQGIYSSWKVSCSGAKEDLQSMKSLSQ